MKRTALVVGIDKYVDPSILDLRYAENDARALAGALEGTSAYETVKLLSSPDSDTLFDEAAALTATMDEGDLFVFFFAGHGKEYERKHLLLCPQVRLSRIRSGNGTVPVDVLKDETWQPGLNRIFIIDACRSSLEVGTRGDNGMAPDRLRDVAMQPIEEIPESGSFALLCSCDRGCQAREIDAQRHGLFTLAMLDLIAKATEGGHGIDLSAALDVEISKRMDLHARKHRLPGKQTPWMERVGPMPDLLVDNADGDFDGAETTIEEPGPSPGSTAMDQKSAATTVQPGVDSDCPCDRLTLAAGDGSHVHVFAGSVNLGRSRGNDIITRNLPDPGGRSWEKAELKRRNLKIGGHHCRIGLADARAWIQDGSPDRRPSRNGTYLDGKRIGRDPVDMSGRRDAKLTLADPNEPDTSLTFRLSIHTCSEFQSSVPEKLHKQVAGEEVAAIVIRRTDAIPETYVILSHWLPVQYIIDTADREWLIARHQTSFGLTNGRTWDWLCPTCRPDAGTGISTVAEKFGQLL